MFYHACTAVLIRDQEICQFGQDQEKYLRVISKVESDYLTILIIH